MGTITKLFLFADRVCSDDAGYAVTCNVCKSNLLQLWEGKLCIIYNIIYPVNTLVVDAVNTERFYSDYPKQVKFWII